MKPIYFSLDTEFLEDGTTIIPISIGIVGPAVGEDGHAVPPFYALNADFALNTATPWLVDNVLRHIPEAQTAIADYWDAQKKEWRGIRGRLHFEPSANVLLKAEIAKQLRDYVQVHALDRGLEPHFVTSYGSYDWLVVCQLFGTMMDLPDGWPVYTDDIQCGIHWLEARDPRFSWIAVRPKNKLPEHNALWDAYNQREEFVVVYRLLAGLPATPENQPRYYENAEALRRNAVDTWQQQHA